jgi:membrane protease YdiL (CAAX protease family)
MVGGNGGAVTAVRTSSSLDLNTHHLATSVAIAWMLGLVALTSAGWLGSVLTSVLGGGPRLQQGIQALAMSGIALPGVWWLRTRRDGRSLEGVALCGIRRSVACFAIGCSLIALPTTLAVVLAVAFGWATVSANGAPGTAVAIGMAVVTALLFEALPEEILFRGYIYRTLNTSMRRWTAGLTTTALFVVLPMIAVQIQHSVLGLEVHVGNSTSVTVGYLVTLFVFGSIQQFLRILTDSTWTCVGFHLVFLLSNRVVGVRESALIRLSDITSEAPLQLVFIGSTLVIMSGLLLYPRLTGRSLGLRAVVPE